MADIRAFVCGHPIAHSRSPKIHQSWLRQYQINGFYDAVDVAPSHIEAFLTGLSEKGFVGGNVTIPHKEEAFRLVRKHDAAAEAIGAVNTVWLQEGLLMGANTDAYGFAANLDERAPQWDKGRVALVLGAGGASRAVIQALVERGYRDIRVVNRTLARAQDLARVFPGRPCPSTDTPKRSWRGTRSWNNKYPGS